MVAMEYQKKSLAQCLRFRFSDLLFRIHDQCTPNLNSINCSMMKLVILFIYYKLIIQQGEWATVGTHAWDLQHMDLTPESLRLLSHWGGAGIGGKAPVVLVVLSCCYSGPLALLSGW